MPSYFLDSSAFIKYFFIERGQNGLMGFSLPQITITRALCANDALQLASALKTNRELINLGSPSLTFISSDVRLLAAAQAEGLSADNPENYP